MSSLALSNSPRRLAAPQESRKGLWQCCKARCAMPLAVELLSLLLEDLPRRRVVLTLLKGAWQDIAAKGYAAFLQIFLCLSRPESSLREL